MLPSMMNKVVSLLLALALCLGGAACSKKKKKGKPGSDPKKKAAARVDAIKQYRMLVQKYPDTEFAPKAQERLAALAAKKK